VLCNTQEDKQRSMKEKQSTRKLRNRKLKADHLFQLLFTFFLNICANDTNLNHKARKEYSTVKGKTEEFSLMRPQGLKSLIPISKNNTVFNCCIGSGL